MVTDDKWKKKFIHHLYEPVPLEGEGGLGYGPTDDDAPGGGYGGVPTVFSRRYRLRRWWEEQVARRPDGFQFPCYGIVLALKGDHEVVDYLLKYGADLNAISGKYCLVMALVGKRLRRMGFDRGWRYTRRSEPVEVPGSVYDEEMMQKAIQEGLKKGYAGPVADFFGIQRKDLPCLVLFRNPRESERAVVSLKGQSVAQISATMALVFDAVADAAQKDKDLIQAVVRQIRLKSLAKTGKEVVVGIGKAAYPILEIILLFLG
jgi:hypothetical protein